MAIIHCILPIISQSAGNQRRLTMYSRLTSQLLKFIPLCAACLYPSVAFGHPPFEAGDLLLLCYNIIKGLVICIAVIVFLVILMKTNNAISSKRQQFDLKVQCNTIYGELSDKSKLSSTIYSIPEIRTRLEPVFSKYNVSSAFILGAYAIGTATTNSQIKIFAKLNIINGSSNTSILLLDDIMNTLGKNAALLDAKNFDQNTTNQILAQSIQIYGQV